MKKQFVKLAAAVLAASVLLSVAACNNKKSGGGSSTHSGKKITADMPWFDTKTFNADVGIDRKEDIEYTYTQLAGADKDYIVTMTSGNYKMPSNLDWDTVDYKDYVIGLLTVFDRKTGEKVNTFNLYDYMDEQAYPSGATYRDGNVLITASTWDDKTGVMGTVEMDVDPVSGELLDKRDVGTGNSDAPQIFDVGNYQVYLTSHWEEKSYYSIRVKTSEGESEEIDIKDDNKDIYYISSIFPVSDTKIMLPADTDSGMTYFEFDLKTNELTKVDGKDYEWLDSVYLYNSYYGSDGNVYVSTPVGISKVDMQKKSVEEIFNFSWCNVSRNLLLDLQIADITEDAFLLCGSVYTRTPYSGNYNWNDDEYVIINFTRADKNPHAGKKILELYAAYGYTEDVTAEAIAKYNETSNDYFIEVTDRYSNVANMNYSSYNNDDDVNAASLDYTNQMSNKLAMDVMNGEGPDMFLDVSYLGQLNSGTYLADLTPFIGNLDSNKYFTNIVDLAKVDGKLYNLPVCFGLSGIHTDKEYAGASGVGFTTEEYEKFLKDVLNGEDVITNGQAHYFATLFNTMRDEFIVNGKADFTGPEFAKIAGYVKENVKEKSDDWDENDGGNIVYADEPMEIKKAVYTSSYGFSEYFMTLEQLSKGNAILGLPSSDGRGPSAISYSSIAVSAQACDVNACGEFVKMLMSDDMQQKYAEHGAFVLNREAFRKAGEGAVDYYNKHSVRGMYSTMDNGPEDNRVKYSTEHIDILEDTILNCSTMTSEDAAVNLILIEEMPAYFTGQKSLEEVVKVAQDRVQKVLDERG